MENENLTVVGEIATNIDRNTKKTYRIVSCAADGSYVIRDFDGPEDIAKRHTQIGIDDCSLDLEIRGLPIFQGLIGPIPEVDKEGKIVRYETQEVFEAMAKKQYEMPSQSIRSTRKSKR